MTTIPGRGVMFGLAMIASLGGSHAVAQADEAKVRTLFEALELPGIIAVMQQEGFTYADQLATDLLGGETGASWQATITGIYDAERMERMAFEGLVDTLDGANVDAMIAFYEAEPGRRIPPLEVSAREAMLDDEIEEAAKEIANRARAEENDRFRLAREFVEANDLIELNVMGALNSNLAFYDGLRSGGALPPEMTQDQILNEVWAQEEEIRDNTIEWVYAFVMLAYQPLAPADLQAFTAFSETDAGQQMNQALFEAFDRMFLEISRSLGAAAAEEMTTQEL